MHQHHCSCCFHSHAVPATLSLTILGPLHAHKDCLFTDLVMTLESGAAGQENQDPLLDIMILHIRLVRLAHPTNVV